MLSTCSKAGEGSDAHHPDSALRLSLSSPPLPLAREHKEANCGSVHPSGVPKPQLTWFPLRFLLYFNEPTISSYCALAAS